MDRLDSAAFRSGLRLTAAVLLVAFVATLVTTIGQGGGQAPVSDDSLFPLSIGRPDLGHVADEDLAVEAGLEQGHLPAEAPHALRIDGARGLSGMVRVRDESDHLAGLTIVPKDDVALLGVHDEGPLDVPIDYRTTAFGLLATQPGFATSEPTVTVLISALVADLPELDTLAETLEQDAGDDPAYLEDLSGQAIADLTNLILAFQENAARLDAELGSNDSGTGTTSTTIALRVPIQEQSDPDRCHPNRVENVIVVDTRRQDHVCLTEADFNGTAWEVKGRSSTPRWAVARPINAGTPAEEIGFVPGKALAIPELPGLAADLAAAAAEGVFNEVANDAIGVCNGLASLVGKRCAEPRPDFAQPFIDQVSSYFDDADVDLALDGSESQTVLSVNGFGFAGGEAAGEDIATSVMITFVMTVVAPTIEIFVDLPFRRTGLNEVSPEFIKALEDTAASLLPDIAALAEAIRTGGITDRLGTLADFVGTAVGAALDEGLVTVVLRDFFLSRGSGAVAEVLVALTQSLSAGVLTWINVGIDVLNAGVTLLMLADDIGGLSTSARYALGYETLPPLDVITSDPQAPVARDPLPNPDLPAETCGLRVALVLDRSSSIRTAGDEAMADVRRAAVGLVDALGSTPSSVRITAFGAWPTTRIGWTSLASPRGRQDSRQAANGIEFASFGDLSGSTNWEAALSDVQGQEADLAVLVTDGNPTSYGLGIETQGSTGGSLEFDPEALAAGVEAANILKTNGTRVVAVGAGEVNVDPLRQVSGPDEGVDYFVGSYDTLTSSLAEVAAELCGAGVTVRHLVDGSPTGDAEYTFELSGEDTQSRVTTADGTARLPLSTGVEAAVTIRGPAGLPLEEVVCDQDGAPLDTPVESGRAVTIDVEGVITCSFSWRGLSDSEAVLGQILRGPGQVKVVSFEPVPSATGTIHGCLDAELSVTGDIQGRCRTAGFGVSFADGFAVLRFDDTCAGCREAALLEVTSVSGGVRFQLDVGGLPTNGIGLDQVDLDMTVTAPSGSQPDVLSGTVGSSHDALVYVRQPSDGDTCLARLSAVGPIFAADRTITAGTGC